MRPTLLWPSSWGECIQFANSIIAHWPVREYARPYESTAERQEDRFLPLLESLGEASLAFAWIVDVLAADVTIEPGPSLGNLCQQHGWLAFQDELRGVFQRTTNETIERNARLLAALCLRSDRTAGRLKLCTALAQEMLPGLQRWDADPVTQDWRTARVDRSTLLSLLTKSFMAIDGLALLEELVEHVLDRPNRYDITTVQVPALLDVHPWLKRDAGPLAGPMLRWLAASHEASI